MSFMDRIRSLFGRKSGAEYGAAATTGAVVASTSDDPGRDTDDPADSGAEAGGGWDVGGGDGGGGGGDGGGGDGGGGSG